MNYGFQGRLTPEFPSQLIIDVTEVCNLACIHCPHPEFKKGPHYSAAMLEPELVRKAVDEVAQHGTQFIRFTSEGEPLVHPGIYGMLDYAVANSKTFVCLTTNGTTMNTPRMHKLLKSGIHMVDISIDAATTETYNRVRRPSMPKYGLHAVVQNVLRLRDEIRSIPDCRTKVVVSFIEQDANRHEVEPFTAFWRSHGVVPIIRREHSAAGAVTRVKWDLWDRLAHEKRRPCVYPWERIVLNPRGFLSFCPADWTKGAEMIDYRTTTIKETWTGSFYRELREAHIKNDFKCHQFCGQCPDWAVTSWPDQGEGYADLVRDLQS